MEGRCKEKSGVTVESRGQNLRQKNRGQKYGNQREDGWRISHPKERLPDAIRSRFTHADQS